MNDVIPVSRPHFFGREEAYVSEALRSTMISGSGPFVDRMETLVARAAGTRHAVAVSNGTVALDLALEALDVEAGDEVIVPDFTMFSPIAALLRRSATIVPVDLDETWNMDADLIEAALTERTKGVVIVHTYGHPADAVRICALAHEHGLWVLEDAAEAMGSKLDGKPAGSFGDLATFSFYANKVVTSGEGGAVVTDDAAMAKRLRALRNLCFGCSWADRFVHHAVGFNFRLSNVLAAIGCAQLENLDAALSSKRGVAKRYRQRLAAVPQVDVQPESPRVEHSYWVFGTLLPARADKAAVAEAMRVGGIEIRPFFHPVHRQPCVRALEGTFPRADEVAARGVYLPSYVGMTDAEIDRVVGTLEEALVR